MDVLLEFLPFLLFLLYAVLRAFRGAQRQARRPPSPGEQAPQRVSMEEFTRRLEAILDEQDPDAVDRREALSDAEPVPPARAIPERPVPRRPVPEPEFHNAEVAVDESASFQHGRHGFGAENPFSEEMFEARPTFAESIVPRPDRPTFDPHGLRREARETPGGTSRASRWAGRLADPERAREALILQAILDRPHARRR